MSAVRGALWYRLLGAEPYDSVFDVGGNVGDFAELARQTWPAARVTSFEPLPEIADVQRDRSNGRWWVEPVAISGGRGTVTMHRCDNQHTASTLQEPGTARAEHFGIRDKFTSVQVATAPLDDYLRHADGRLLVKIDVEGHERDRRRRRRAQISGGGDHRSAERSADLTRIADTGGSGPAAVRVRARLRGARGRVQFAGGGSAPVRRDLSALSVGEFPQVILSKLHDPQVTRASCTMC